MLMETDVHKMQFVESVVYLGILCIHYPLRITFATTRTGKTIVKKGIEVQKSVKSSVITTVAKQYQTVTDAFESVKNAITNFSLLSLIPWSAEEPSPPQEPKNQYEKTFLKFQVAAFEKERVEYQKEIRRLQDELQRAQHKYNNFDKERQKCDKQIKTLEEHLNEAHTRYNSEKLRIISEFEEEKQYLKQEIMKLQNQLNRSQLDFEQLSKMHVAGFDRERQQYQQELRKLYAKISQLENELEDARKENDVQDGDHSENDEDEDNLLNPYINQSLQTIDHIKKEALETKKKISNTNIKEKSEELQKVNDKLISDLAELENIKIKGYRIVKKRRQETIKLLNKFLDELKHQM